MAERVTGYKVLGVLFDIQLSFEGHIRMKSDFASSKLEIMRKALCLFGDPVLVSRLLFF